MKILLVEDDEIIAQTLVDILRDRHYVVDLATEGDLGWEMVEAYDYELIILDIELPKLNGIELCKKLRNAGNQTPVLLLTAQNSNDKKVIGLDAGADDYVVKPFEISELLARIRVLLRRRNSIASPILQWGNLNLNPATQEVIYHQQILNLTPKEYRLLELFLRSGDRVLTREQILDRLWDIEEAPSESTVTAHIKDLRRKLKQVGADANLIETIYGVGYRLKPLNIEAKSTLSDCEINQSDYAPRTLRDRQTEQIRQKTTTALAEVWQRYEGAYHERLAILERANQAWQAGKLTGQLLQQAQWAAHKLAGSLGVFGFSQGSHLALEMEQLLKIELDTNRSKQFSQLLIALKKALKPNFKSQLNPVNRTLVSPKGYTFGYRYNGGNPHNALTRNRPVILAVDNHPELVQQLVDEMTAIGTIFALVSQPSSMKKALQMNFDAVVWEFSLADCSAKILDQFALIINAKIPVPVILLTDRHEQSDRAQIARLGGHVLLQEASLDAQATKAIVKALQQSQHKVAKVLAVDDDPQILAAIDNLLNPLKIELTILDNPLDFWQIIDRLKPDLLILDVNMPHFSGIELCQSLRNDLRWRELPILFFTVHHDLNTVHQILTAGANDCISKVVSPSELVPKIFNHLNRGQLLTSLIT
ncbi:hypothetical protein C7B62_21555 [Pleurocapsa sp. CCALA 161]|uniref:response regulator n=1 Tax=Pleurocapsa sp. CCALA 161 TaxID=2107688 RepID=UPI000D06A70F|nr:response regulator [Pleurocapsa sp. CCALA 161]PSB06884.1 hypothetical protein C7B62_21555 [Pleurocapsa sp. CCALA 161]